VPPDPPADEVLELIGSPESISTDSATEQELEVDEVALQILGAVPGDAQPDTADLHPAVLKRWTHWVYHGLETEERADLLSFYPIPADSVFLAPPLNEELKAHLDKVATARDRHLLTTQECLGAGLLAVGQALSTLVADNESLDGALVLQTYRMRANYSVSGLPCPVRPNKETGSFSSLVALRLMFFVSADLFYQTSRSRRALVLPKIADETAKQVALDSKPKGFLFGKGLGERVKAAQDAAAAAKRMFSDRSALSSPRVSGNGGGLAGRKPGRSVLAPRRSAPPRKEYRPRQYGPTRPQPYTTSHRTYKPPPTQYQRRP